MFEVDGYYANRKGRYKVVALDPPRMTVRYDDGSEAELNINIQARIWENILAEREAEAVRSGKRNGASQKGQFFVKTLSLLVAEDLSILGLRQRVAAARMTVEPLRADARLIYYAIEPRVFFAVATVTGTPKKAPAHEYVNNSLEGEEIFLYPIDVDAHARTLENAVDLDSVELESQPEFKQLLQQPDIYLPINEDDFELLAELLTEVTEEADDDDDEDDNGEDLD